MTRAIAMLACLLIAATVLPKTVSAEEGASGLLLPRFVSLRADQVNLRTGPGVRYPIDWVFERKGLPVQIIAEFEAWRQVRDSEGATGWVHRSMLSGKRTVMINGDVDRMFREPKSKALVTGYVEAGIIGDVLECEGAWCRIGIANPHVEGWIERRGLWGVMPGEEVR